MHLVLVHGFFNNAFFMGWMSRYLSAEGHVCHVPTLKPSDGRHGLDALASQLKMYVDDVLPADEPFAIAGFSMGALVVRFYLQELGGHERARAYFSIAGPHHGTPYARFYPGAGARDMRPGSPFLEVLEHYAPLVQALPKICYWTPHDVLIHPPESAVFTGAESVKIASYSHALLLLDKRLFADIARRLVLLDHGSVAEPPK